MQTIYLMQTLYSIRETLGNDDSPAICCLLANVEKSFAAQLQDVPVGERLWWLQGACTYPITVFGLEYVVYRVSCSLIPIVMAD